MKQRFAIYRRLLGYLVPYRQHVSLAYSAMMFSALLNIIVPQVVKVFAREPYEFERFDTENNVWLGLRSSVLRVWGNNWPLFTYLLMLGVFVLLWVGGPYVMRGEITVGSLFALISYLLILNGPVQRLGYLVNLAATDYRSQRHNRRTKSHKEHKEKQKSCSL